MNRIYICRKCDEYTMELKCGCGRTSEDVRPPKYSPEDRYKKYRQDEKKKELAKRELY
ncbi:MAG: nucleolar RNA-binding Nop10p family protein [Candidatus Nanoarchaeia archaeon]|nr:nucleolar RNA-binding Nop10p family protein [Candidatus Nanoarchaeia archaeon]